MFFVKQGVVEILLLRSQKVLAVVGRGEYFGEVAILYAQRRGASARAVTFTLILTLHQAHLATIVERYAHVKAALKSEAEVRAGNMRNHSKPAEIDAKPLKSAGSLFAEKALAAEQAAQNPYAAEPAVALAISVTPLTRIMTAPAHKAVARTRLELQARRVGGSTGSFSGSSLPLRDLSGSSMASSSSASSFSLCLRGLRLGTRSEGSSSSSSSSSTLTRCLRGMKEGLETPAVRVSRATRRRG